MDIAIERNVSNSSEVSADIRLINKKFLEELIYLWYETDGTEKGKFNNSSIAACVFFAAEMFYYKAVA
jgi:hypothetical protein